MTDTKNPVYLLTLRSIGRLAPEGAAITLLNEVLRGQQLAPDSVTADEMQSILFGPLLERLSNISRHDQASEALQGLSEELAALMLGQLSAPASTDPDDDFELEFEDEAAPLDFGDDDFEFDDPDYGVASAAARQYDLRQDSDQEQLIRELGRITGVESVMICSAAGQVLRSRAMRDMTQLGGVVAATNLLFGQKLRLMSASLGQSTVCMRPLGNYCVAVIAGPQVNVGRLLTELQQVQEAAA
ncbi:roadblock/LC7 domain-containing protein [Deinococcus lacus]|uniref:Roadblock/LC7 domain-containing protein n=1 Tax=Deinococcus lacus TaxID=392561 RepID=A0ABW1YD40_9DEIO